MLRQILTYVLLICGILYIGYEGYQLGVSDTKKDLKTIVYEIESTYNMGWLDGETSSARRTMENISRDSIKKRDSLNFTLIKKLH